MVNNFLTDKTDADILHISLITIRPVCVNKSIPEVHWKKQQSICIHCRHMFYQHPKKTCSQCRCNNFKAYHPQPTKRYVIIDEDDAWSDDDYDDDYHGHIFDPFEFC